MVMTRATKSSTTKYINLLNREVNLLTTILKRIKLQHGPTLIYRRAYYLKRLVKKYLLLKTNKNNLMENIRKFYVLVSSNFSVNHFVPLTLCFIGVSGRMYSCVEKIVFDEEKEMKEVVRKKFLDDLFK